MNKRPTRESRPGHACSVSAVQLLETRSRAGRWVWVIKLDRFTAMIHHCPWCGAQLPARAEPVALLALIPTPPSDNEEDVAQAEEA